jgi:hypothetical protein
MKPLHKNKKKITLPILIAISLQGLASGLLTGVFLMPFPVIT